MNVRASTPVLLQAFGLRAALPVLLRTLPLDRVLEVLTPRVAAAPSSSVTLATIEAITDVVTRRIPGLRTACLQRALMRYALLRRSGFAATFMIGVRAGGTDGFEAHAWVTHADAPIMELEPVTYRSTFVWPRAQSAAQSTNAADAAVIDRLTRQS